MPPCPPYLDGQARRTWRQLAPTLLRLNLLTEADGLTFAVLCQLQARMQFIVRELKKKEHRSLTQYTDKGELKANPGTVMERQYYQLFRQYAAEFGLTPRGRVGLAVATNDEDDEMAGLLD